jgi:hypothetical protein
MEVRAYPSISFFQIQRGVAESDADLCSVSLPPLCLCASVVPL